MNLDTLHDLAATITAERSVARVLQSAVEGLASEPQIALARVWLIGPGDACADCAMRPTCPDQRHCLHLKASDGSSVDPGEARWRGLVGSFRRLPLRARGLGRVASTGEAVLMNEGDDARELILDPSWAKHERINSFGAQPLIFRGEILGVLGVFSRAALDDEAMRVLRTFANQAAVALANAAAFEQVERLKAQLEEENHYLKAEARSSRASSELLGDSPPMHAVRQQIAIAARSNAPVLIQGESGTGKELIARAIYEHGDRAKKPFITVNCAAVPRELFESEFFGHAKGAFTGAVAQRAGRFALADGGTLFLDEVGEIPLELQAKLLRVIQEGRYERIGEETTRRVNVHIIAATNRDLLSEVNAGRFRADLYYRINVFPIAAPPLRARIDDIPTLARRFVQESCARLRLPAKQIEERDLAAMRAYAWPGNVRELQNVVERSVLMAGEGPLRLARSLPSNAQLPPRESDSTAPTTLHTYTDLRRFERDTVTRALESTRYRVAGPGGAAELLETKPTTLAYRMKVLNIERPKRGLG